MKRIYTMSMEVTLDIIGGKWKPIILCKLSHRAMRSGELKREMPDVTQKMLTQQLRELERDNIIERTVFEQVPPKVIYSLTDEGRSLKDVLVAMSVWGERRVKHEQNQGNDVEVLSNEFEGFLNM